MEINAATKRRLTAKQKPDSHLHSPSHVLADELSRKFGEPKRFGFYLKMATTHNHSFLRRIAAEVTEGKSPAKKPGALFAFLVKKEKDGSRKWSCQLKSTQILCCASQAWPSSFRSRRAS